MWVWRFGWGSTTIVVVGCYGYVDYHHCNGDLAHRSGSLLCCEGTACVMERRMTSQTVTCAVRAVVQKLAPNSTSTIILNICGEWPFCGYDATKRSCGGVVIGCGSDLGRPQDFGFCDLRELFVSLGACEYLVDIVNWQGELCGQWIALQLHGRGVKTQLLQDCCCFIVSDDIQHVATLCTLINSGYRTYHHVVMIILLDKLW